MQTIDETLEMLFAALRAVVPPRDMQRRILERCATWLIYRDSDATGQWRPRNN